MKGIFDWVPWFRALSAKIADAGEQGLIDRARTVDWGVKDPFGDGATDPLSFLYVLSSRNGNYAAFESVNRAFDIETPLPDKAASEAWVFPTALPIKAHFSGNGSARPDQLWELFRQAQPRGSKIGADIFESVLNRPGVGVAMLTQALCLANPHAFVPADKFGKVLIGVFPAAASIKKQKEDFTLSDYESFLQGLSETFPGCHFYEIGRFLYEQGTWKDGLVSQDSRYFHVSTRVRGDRGPDFWEQFEEENGVFTGGRASGVEFEDPLPPDKKKPYPLDRPKEGDIVLVRCGVGEGRGIGVVVANDYAKPDGLNVKSRIHVLWINKARSGLAGQTERIAMDEIGSLDRHTFTAFANKEAYRPSFKMLRAIVNVPDPVPVNGPEPNSPAVRHPLNQILYGPPGTGKTWNTVARAVAIVEGKRVEVVEEKGRGPVKARFDSLREAGQITMTTFHQNYAYEDFVEGIRPVLGEDQDGGGQVAYELRLGVLRNIAELASENLRESSAGTDHPADAKNFVLIIDEINRGNIARIFGELITLVEESRRIGGSDETRVRLPYSGDEFGVPENLYIIGTMNTADRSIALLDTALRRRFEFEEMMPKSSLVKRVVDGVNIETLLNTMNRRIRFLRDREHQIGHTYFLDVKDIEGLKKAFQNRIVPLLQEYFYDDWARIDVVLGGNSFIVTVKRPDGLGEEWVDPEQKAYEVLSFEDPEAKKKWDNPVSYQKIYDKKAGGGDKTSETEAKEEAETGGAGGG